MEAGSTGVTVHDVLTGADYITGSFALQINTGTGTFNTVVIGNTADMTVTNQRTGLTIFTIRYDAVENR